MPDTIIYFDPEYVTKKQVKDIMHAVPPILSKYLLAIDIQKYPYKIKVRCEETHELCLNYPPLSIRVYTDETPRRRGNLKQIMDNCDKALHDTGLIDNIPELEDGPESIFKTALCYSEIRTLKKRKKS